MNPRKSTTLSTIAGLAVMAAVTIYGCHRRSQRAAAELDESWSHRRDVFGSVVSLYARTDADRTFLNDRIPKIHDEFRRKRDEQLAKLMPGQKAKRAPAPPQGDYDLAVLSALSDAAAHDGLKQLASDLRTQFELRRPSPTRGNEDLEEIRRQIDEVDVPSTGKSHPKATTGPSTSRPAGN